MLVMAVFSYPKRAHDDFSLNVSTLVFLLHPATVNHTLGLSHFKTVR